MTDMSICPASLTVALEPMWGQRRRLEPTPPGAGLGDAEFAPACSPDVLDDMS